MGDIAVAPSDPRILYAGTGEEDSRNSISPGGGVYKSTDAGLTWTYVGLKETQQIGKVLVHPRDPNTVYVAALGHLWGANPERGVYKTTDGGATWQRVKFVSDRAGFVDLAMDPTNPDVLWAASWERVRGPYFLRSGGPGSGLWKSTDAGRSWSEVSGGGFPAQTKGRIGLAIAESDPRTMYAMIEADTLPNPRRGPRRARRDRRGVDRPRRAGARAQEPEWALPVHRWRTHVGAHAAQRERRAPVLLLAGARRSHRRQPRLLDVERLPLVGGRRQDRTARRAGRAHRLARMWIDPKDPAHWIQGNDGGVYVTWDRGGTYDFLNTMPLGQFYAVSFDMRTPYRVCGGLQDNGSWCGPSRTTLTAG
jgi:hypothetical protein